MLRREDGAIAILVAVLMTAFLAAGAYAIDLGSGRQAETKAQSTADASALAAADTLSGCTGTTTACAASATTAAQSLAASNGYPSNSNCSAPNTVGLCVTAPYNGSPYMAKVTEVVSAGATLGGRSGGASPLEGASSIAAGTQTTSTSVTSTTQTISTSTTSVTTGTTTNVTTTPAPVIFTNSTNCSGVELQNMNGGTISSIVTDGGLYESGNNGGTLNSVSYGSGCGAPGAHPTVGSATTNSGALSFPIDPRQSSQTIQCPNTNSGSPAGSVTESQNGGTDSYSYSVASMTIQNSPNLSGVYCASQLSLPSGGITDTSGAPITFIASTFSGGVAATLPSSVKSGAIDGIILWQTSANQLAINNGSFMASSGSSNFVVFAPLAQIYVNSSNGWPSQNSGFSLESNTFDEAGFPSSYTYSSPSGVGSTSTSTTTTTGTTTIPTTTTTVSSSTSTSTGSGPSALSG